jgi:trk system potassium uptake protein TrkA
METHSSELVPLLLVIAMAFIVPVVLNRLKIRFIPVVVGEIIAGLLFGKSGFGIIHEGPMLEMLATLGFIFLMFLSGLEISFSGMLGAQDATKGGAVRRILGSHLSLAILSFVATLALSLGMAAAMVEGGWVGDPWIMGLILCTTSLGIVVPVLKERRIVDTPLGQLILFSALVADFGSILMVSVYVLFLKRGITAEVLLILLLFAAFAAVYRIAAVFQRKLPAERLFKGMSTATSQIRLRGALALALVFAVLASSLGVETILGAFLAGVIVSMLTGEGRSSLQEKLDAIGYGFLIPIFFITIGAGVDIQALIAAEYALTLLPALVVMAFVVKFSAAAVFIPFYSLRQAAAAGALLSARLSLIIAVALIGHDLGVISDAMNSAVVLLAVVTCTLAPMVFRWVAPPRPKPRNRIVVVGCRHVIEMLGQRLQSHSLDAATICPDAKDRRRSQERGVPSSLRRESVVTAMREAGAERARMVISLSEEDEDNLLICRIAKEIFGVKEVIAWAQEMSHENDYKQMGVRIVNPASATVSFIEAVAVHANVYDMAGETDAEMTVKQVKLKNSPLVGRRIQEISLGDDITIIGIIRGGEQLVPDNLTVIQANDTLTLIGSASALDITLQELVGK